MRWLMFFRIKLQYLACNEIEKKNPRNQITSVFPRHWVYERNKVLL